MDPKQYVGQISLKKKCSKNLGAYTSQNTNIIHTSKVNKFESLTTELH